MDCLGLVGRIRVMTMPLSTSGHRVHFISHSLVIMFSVLHVVYNRYNVYAIS